MLFFTDNIDFQERYQIRNDILERQLFSSGPVKSCCCSSRTFIFKSIRNIIDENVYKSIQFTCNKNVCVCIQKRRKQDETRRT